MFSLHKDSLSRAEAENLLAHGCLAERKKAATELGNLCSIHSYEPLLLAVQRKDNDRGVQLAILHALHSIGEKFGYTERFSGGLIVLEQFIKSNLKDLGLVNAACQAIQWAGTIDDISDVGDRIRDAAGNRYPQAAAATSRLYLSFVSAD